MRRRAGACCVQGAAARRTGLGGETAGSTPSPIRAAFPALRVAPVQGWQQAGADMRGCWSGDATRRACVLITGTGQRWRSAGRVNGVSRAHHPRDRPGRECPGQPGERAFAQSRRPDRQAPSPQRQPRGLRLHRTRPAAMADQFRPKTSEGHLCQSDLRFPKLTSNLRAARKMTKARAMAGRCSAVLLQQALLLAVPVALGRGLAFVGILLALGDADLQLHDATVVEIHHQRHQGHALARGRGP